MQHLTKCDRISLLIISNWSDRLRSYPDVKDLFNATLRNKNPISYFEIKRTIRRFEKNWKALKIVLKQEGHHQQQMKKGYWMFYNHL